MVFILLCTRPLKYIFKKENISDEIYYDTLMDLKCKIDECKLLYGVVGTFVAGWYKAVYNCPIIKLGRLEYEKVTIKYDYKNFEKCGDTVLGCHIPSCGALKKEDAEESLKKAYEFFNIKGYMVAQCHSWMMYPPHYELFPENSNLRMFYNLFDIVSQNESGNADMWRIFYKQTDDFDDLPQNTVLQKSFARYLKAGNKMGDGIGILIFDGERIITERNEH